MSIRLLLRDYPQRAIGLVTKSHALIFRPSPSSNEGGLNGSSQCIHSLPSTASAGSSPRCMVEFVELENIDLSDYRSLSPQQVQGTLGLITINNDIFLCVVSGASQVAEVRRNETVKRIHGVEFCRSQGSRPESLFSVNTNPEADTCV